jgi:hypothetical protein
MLALAAQEHGRAVVRDRRVGRSVRQGDGGAHVSKAQGEAKARSSCVPRAKEAAVHVV